MADSFENSVVPPDDVAKEFDQRNSSPVPSSVVNSDGPSPTDESYRLINDGIRRLGEQFEQRLAIDAVKDAQIKQLHAELLQHRQGLATALVQPLLLAMIRVRDDICRRIATLQQSTVNPDSPESAVRELESVQDDLMLALEAGGASAYEEPQPTFNPTRQQSIRVVPTPDPSQHGVIAERVQPGYEFNGRILIKERVRVCVHDAAAAVKATLAADAAPPAPPAVVPAPPVEPSSPEPAAGADSV